MIEMLKIFLKISIKHVLNIIMRKLIKRKDFKWFIINPKRSLRIKEKKWNEKIIEKKKEVKHKDNKMIWSSSEL